MEYKLIGTTIPAVEITFDQRGESVYTESGAMCWMSNDVNMESNAKGGVSRSLGRMFSGESIFMVSFTSKAAGDYVAFSSSYTGDIIPLKLNGNKLICQKDAFLCAESSVTLKTLFRKKLGAGVFGGEGFILQELSGTGQAFLEINGNMIKKKLGAGEVIKVDTGNVVAFESSVNYDIESVKGVKNILLGGEGLFLTKLTGPGTIYLQSSNFADMVSKISTAIPSK